MSAVVDETFVSAILTGYCVAVVVVAIVFSGYCSVRYGFGYSVCAGWTKVHSHTVLGVVWGIGVCSSGSGGSGGAVDW